MKPPRNNSSLLVQVLSVIGGLLSAFCLILGLVLAEITHTEGVLGFIGLCMIGATIAGNRVIDQLFLGTIITAFYIAGCLALATAMVSSGWNVQVVCLVFMLIAILTIFLSRGVLFPFLAVLIFNAAVPFLIMVKADKIEISQFIVAWMGICFLALNFFEAKIVAAHSMAKRLFRPLHAGFFLTFVCGLVWISGIGYTFDKSVGILSVFIWAGIALMLRQIMKVMKVEKPEIEVGVYVACFAMLIPTIFAPSLSGALLLLLVCFGFGYKTEMAASLVLLIYTIVKYYYDLQLTLLMKSGTLFFTGIVLLLVWYFFTKQTRKHEKI